MNFNGTASNSSFTLANGGIRAELNVSSVTNHGNGDYEAHFANNLDDANYVVSIIGGYDDGTNHYVYGSLKDQTANPSASSVRFVTALPHSPWRDDCEFVSVIIFGS